MVGDAARESRSSDQVTLAVSPSGRLRLVENPDASSLDPWPAEAVVAVFAGGTVPGFFHLDVVEVHASAGSHCPA